MKKGLNNSWLKFVRMFIVFIGWSMVAFKSETVDIMCINMFIFVLGLLYDYMCVMDVYDNLYQKIFSTIGLGTSIVILVIIITKFLEILELDVKKLYI